MIIGIGIDAVEIERFANWHTYEIQKLNRYFSEEEIAYCLRSKEKSAERFAARFVAKESFLKALNPIIPDHNLNLPGVCANVSVQNLNNGIPQLNINWHYFVQFHAKLKQQTLQVFISLTHSNQLAIAVVVIEQI